jgi:NhaP-type Na+/H+ or K+/H+ antiporter
VRIERVGWMFPPDCCADSSLSLRKEHLVNDFGRIGFLAVVGTLFTVFGAAIGLYNWILAASKGVPSTTGTV